MRLYRQEEHSQMDDGSDSESSSTSSSSSSTGTERSSSGMKTAEDDEDNGGTGRASPPSSPRGAFRPHVLDRSLSALTGILFVGLSTQEEVCRVLQITDFVDDTIRTLRFRREEILHLPLLGG